jgi:N-acetylated-alpha-linked acidic dipeptidase
LRLSRIEGASVEDGNELRNRADLRIGALGSGSDYTAFLDHLGIASLDLGYGGEDGGGIYHSIYDDFYWYTHFADTDFRYCRALAETVGITVCAWRMRTCCHLTSAASPIPFTRMWTS